jgi:transcriptional regulator with XRE-family HTH domain
VTPSKYIQFLYYMKDSSLDIHECIEFILQAKGMTVYALSKELGFDKPAKLYTILNRRTKPSYETLVSITRRFEDVNGDWLLRGTGLPFVSPKNGSTPDNQTELLHERNRSLQTQIADRDETIELLKQQIMILREVINHSHRNEVLS